MSFARENGKTPNDIWLAGVARLSDEQIIHGLSVLAESDMEFPPNFPKFRRACLSRSALDSERLLPAPECTVQSEMRSALSYGIPREDLEGLDVEQIKAKIFEKRTGVRLGEV